VLLSESITVLRVIFVVEYKLNPQEGHFVLFSTESLLEATLHSFGLYSAFGKSLWSWATVESSWNVTSRGDASEGKFGTLLCNHKSRWKWCPLLSPVSPSLPSVRHRTPSQFNWTLPQPKCIATFRTHCIRFCFFQQWNSQDHHVGGYTCRNYWHNILKIFIKSSI